jgi:hypothetical protein
MERLRTPFFIVAMVAAGLAVLVELGATYLVGGGPADPGQLAQQVAGLGVDVPAGGQVGQPPGIAIPYLALIDVIVVFTVALMGAGMVVPDRLHGRLQGIITLIGAIILIITAIVLVFVALGELILMVTLLLAFPFGTIAYLIIWGSFPRGEAAVILSLLMFLKLVFAGMLVAAQQRFIQNKGLVALVITTLVANLVVAFLHGIVPGILVSITDAIAAIVLAIVAIIWGLVLAIGSIPSIVNAIRATAAEAQGTAQAAIPA